jgi:hypothetical protein
MRRYASLLMSGRGRPLAVAVFGAFASGSFTAGVRESLLVSGALLLASTVAPFTMFRQAAS